MTTAALATDRQDIADLVARLGRWLDHHDWEAAASVMTEDVAVRSPAGIAEGLRAVVDQARRNHQDAATQHAFTDVLVDLDGDRATASANLLATFAEGDAEPAPFFAIAARYGFEAARADDGWRLARIEITPVWTWGRRPV